MANIKADEITKILREQIENYQQTLAVDEVGSVISVGDGIARVHGLDKCMAGEMLAFPNDVFGIALNLEEDQVGVVLLGDYTKIEEGDIVKRTNKIMSVPVGDAMLGRVVDALGNPVDDKGPIQTDKRNALERLAPGVIDRQPVREPVQTGIKSIDAMIPIGRGPPDRKDRDHFGHDHQPARRRHDLYLLRHRAEAFDHRADREDPDR
jgi:F-type H+-transporting ATPase subunit alpha